MIIKYPFWKMTLQNRQAIYACVNRGQAICPADLRRQAVCIDGDIDMVLDKLLVTPSPQTSQENHAFHAGSIIRL